MDDWMQAQQQINQQAQQQINQQGQQQMHQEAPQQFRQEDPQQLRQEDPQQLRQEAQQQLNQQAQVNFPPVHADAAAAGEAVQQMAPARKTYKARRAEKRRVREEEKRHAAEAHAQCPVGDIVTYDIKHQLEDYYKQHKTLFNRNFPFLGIDPVTNEEKHDMSKNLSGVDRRVLQCFTHGFKTDEAGRPATAADARYQREDEAFYDAFCSTDYIRRAPYLQRMVEEVLSYDLKENMFSDKSLRSNAATFKSMGDRLVYMENVMKDKNNAFFFDTPLCPVKKEVLKKALDTAAPMVSLFKAECEKRGVEPDYRDVPYISEQSALNEFSRQAEFFAGKYKGKPEEFKSLKESLKQEEAKQQSPEIYRQPSGIYHQVRSLLEGDVQRIMDCNLEELSALSDKDLRKRREELDKLYAASLNVEKCLPIKHPYQHKLTLKEDLIGQRRLKYEYKSALLRGLIERADGFTKQGKKRIEAASMRYRNQMTPGTPEFQEFFYSFSGSLLDYYAVPPKFDEVRTEFNELRNLPKESRKGELAEAVERLGDKQYFSLAYSEEQLRDMGMPPTIKGPLFRNLNNFPLYEAAQTLLTPEQLRRMLINLGAGAGLTHASEKETRDEAIEKNNAGLDTYRKVLTAQYDMLERKYGNSLEKLTLRELQEHYLDIAKDFADIQEDGMMAERFPGFIRKDNPDDERLLNRINYYGMCGSAAMGMINYIANIAPKDWASDENMQKRISEVVDMIDDSKKARAYLMEKGESFQHPLDWSQKVKNPADGS